eukprot:TRINITY_DN47118_c0_g1_i1.p1 TRINITY_DN47118_c0_g1~~TRINITY_DN47118_c0_g1_i1.p1  ORF type:complete len:318 (-),score=35.15 TRINITY_DN47118_c0_g1_i1:480-1433(-)
MASRNSNANNANESGSEDWSEEYEEETPWINWFCEMEQNQYYCIVDDSYAEDPFNLVGLEELVPDYEDALDIVLDLASENGYAMFSESDQLRLSSSAQKLYGLIHARFIVTSAGLVRMHDKYTRGEFGSCLRHNCDNTRLLPMGLSDHPGQGTVKLFCPSCRDLFRPPQPQFRNLDGAHWGTTFPHLFLMTYQVSVPRAPSDPYVPRVFGFRIAPPDLIAQVDAKEEAADKGTSGGASASAAASGAAAAAAESRVGGDGQSADAPPAQGQEQEAGSGNGAGAAREDAVKPSGSGAGGRGASATGGRSGSRGRGKSGE